MARAPHLEEEGKKLKTGGLPINLIFTFFKSVRRPNKQRGDAPGQTLALVIRNLTNCLSEEFQRVLQPLALRIPAQPTSMAAKWSRMHWKTQRSWNFFLLFLFSSSNTTYSVCVCVCLCVSVSCVCVRGPGCTRVRWLVYPSPFDSLICSALWACHYVKAVVSDIM